MREQEERVIRDVIASVDDAGQRETAELFYVEGLKCEEIAAKQGISVTAVTTRLARFRAKVHKQLLRRILEIRSGHE